MELCPASGQDLGDLGEYAQFKITQNRGRHNAEVSNKAVRDFCQEAARAASASWQTKWAQTQDLIAKDQEEKRLAKEAQKAKKAAEKKKLAATDETAASAPKPKSKKRPG